MNNAQGTNTLVNIITFVMLRIKTNAWMTQIFVSIISEHI
jgi:hypothetical protein